MLFRGSPEMTGGSRSPDVWLFRLARIPSIEKRINRRARGLIKFYDRSRYAGVRLHYLRYIFITARSARLIWVCARSFSLTLSLAHFPLYLSCTLMHDTVALVPTQAIVSRPDENNRCRKSRTALLSLRDSPQPCCDVSRQNLGQKCR